MVEIDVTADVVVVEVVVVDDSSSVCGCVVSEVFRFVVVLLAEEVFESTRTTEFSDAEV